MARPLTPPRTALIKKYGNRRLYDTDESRYVTLDEVEAKIRGGVDVRVVDAKDGTDLTQATLAQIILESRGAAKLMPVPLMLRLIRMGDDALAEFMGRYVTAALELYLSARQGAQAVAPYFPMANVPFAATNALARLFLQSPPVVSGAWQPQPMTPPEWAQGPGSAEAAYAEALEVGAEQANELAALRRELDEIKSAIGKQREDEPAKPSRAPRKRR